MKKVLIILSFLISVQFATAQNDTISILHHYKEGVGLQFKWISNSSEVFITGFTSGYNLYRAEAIRQSDGGEKLGTYKKLNNDPIKYWSDERVTQAIAVDSIYDIAGLFIGGVNEFINREEIEDMQSAIDMKKSDDFLELLANFTIISSNKCSEALGMYFVDKDNLSKDKYVYKLEVIGHPELDSYLIYLKSSRSVKEKVLGFKAQLVTEAVHLSWYNNGNKNYPYYNIYRSNKKSSGYEKLNSLPYTGGLGNGKTNANVTSFIDSIPEYGKTYYYKVVGVNAFEDEGVFSNVEEVKAYYLLTATPIISSAINDDNDRILLNWVVDSLDEDYIEGFNVFRAGQGAGPYKKVNEKKIPGKERDFLDDTEKGSSNYYILSAYGYAGDSLNSLLKSKLLLDSIPPATPTIVKGVCDTNGIVTLEWSKSLEEDFLGCRIFRTYDTILDPTRVSEELFADTLATDSVNLKRPHNKIYYRMYALDEHLNPSQPTPYFEVILPDKNPPTNGYFKDYNVDITGIKLEWVNSGAYDLAKMHLYRKGDTDFEYKMIKTFEGLGLDTTIFMDTTTKSFAKYLYAVQAEDEAGLTSNISDPIQVQQMDKRKQVAVKNLRAIASQDNKMIKISWNFAEEAQGFRVYRAENKGDLKTYKYIKGNVREFYDKWVKPDTKYTYLLVGDKGNGRKSGYSKKIVVKY